jgi:stage III sporulation protein AF
MKEFLHNWITSIASIIIFISLMELILPSSSIKKYTRIVTGLIVMITILNPVFKLFDRQADIQTYISQYASTYNVDTSGTDKKVIEKRVEEQTIEVYKKKLSEKIENEIRNETGNKYSVKDLVVNEDVNSIEFGSIKYIELKSVLNDKSIKPVDTVVIGQNTSNTQEFKDEKVLSMLKDTYYIEPSTVKFVK